MTIMKTFQRQEHRIIASALQLMDPAFLLDNSCWFAGGTAIVMMLGEYRRSLDVDFLCSDVDGYRMLRSVAVEKGMEGLFAAPVEALREVRADQYGVRTIISLKGQAIRFEIVRESRIALQGGIDVNLGVPVLSRPDMMAEKLLANADRCQDRSVAYRDAIDLGMLIHHFGPIPQETIAKTEAAYGADIARKAAWVVHRLEDAEELRHAAEALVMKTEDAERAIRALTTETQRLWPSAFSHCSD
jgi:hypothetical protein